MTVGLPGTGVGGMFYLLSALAMPLREVYGRARRRSTRGGWRAVLEQTGLALGILAGMWVAGWLLGAGVAAVQTTLPAPPPGTPPPGNVLRTVALVVSLGTLVCVLVAVEVLGLWLSRPPSLAGWAGAGRILLLVAGLVAAVPQRLAPQGSSPANAPLARAESAYAAGEPDVAEREYAAVLKADPGNSRATYRLAELRRWHPAQALRLFRRYVELEPSDPWGYMAVGDVLSRTGQHDEALAWYDAALRMAPGERDAVIGRARVMARAGRADSAAATYERWLARHAGDAEARRELGAARAQAAPAFEPTVRGSRDSDGSTVVRFLGALDAGVGGGGTRVGATYSRARTGDGFANAVVDEVAFRARRPPGAGWTLSATVGAARLDAPAESRGVSAGSPNEPPGAPVDTTRRKPGRRNPKDRDAVPSPEPGGVQARRATTVATGLIRARWRPPTGGTVVDLRLRRDVLAATPVLVTNGVVRTELHGMVELPLGSAVKLRGTGRAALLSDRTGDNRRTAWSGAIAFPVARTRTSLQFHETGFAQATTAGYFAPRLTQTMEAESYLEIETARTVSIALTVAAGTQRVARHGAPLSPWRPAFRLYALTVVPLAPGRAIQLELEGEDSSGGSLIATSERWRYGAAAVSLRWAL